METYKIIMIIIVLVLTSVVLYLVLQKKKNDSSSWTEEQINQSFDIIRELDSQKNNPPQNILQELVSELSQKVSFKDFVNSNDKYSLVFGVRGKWCDTMKKVILQNLMKKNTIKGECALCIVGTLESAYTPKEINNFNDDETKKVMALMFNICQGPCHMTPS